MNKHSDNLESGDGMPELSWANFIFIVFVGVVLAMVLAR